MATKHTVDVNVKDKRNSGAGTPTRPAGGDTVAIKSVLQVLERALAKNAKDSASAVEKALRPVLRELLRSAPSGGKDINVDKIVKGIGSEIVREINRSTSKTTGPARSAGAGDVSKAIDKGFDKLASNLTRLVSSKVSSKTGVAINERALANAMGSVLKSAIPQSDNTNARELKSIVDSLKTISRDIGTSIRTIKGAATSGGKVDINEVSGVINEVAKLTKNLSAVNREAEKAKSAFANIAPEFQKEFNKAIGSVRGSATRKAQGVLSNEALDPKKLVREITTGVLADVKKAAKSDPSLGPAIKKLEGAVGDLSKFAAELKNIKTSSKSGDIKQKISVEGIDKVAKSFDKFVSTLNKIPASLGLDKLIPDSIKELLQGLEVFTKKASKVTSTVKLAVDDSKLKKIEKTPLEVKAPIKPDTRELDKVGKEPIEIPAKLDSGSIRGEIAKLREQATKAARDAMRSEGMVESIFRGIEVSLDKGDLDSVRRSLEGLTRIELGPNVKKLANEIRNMTGVVKAELDLDTTKALKQSKELSRQIANDAKKYQLLSRPNNRQMFGQPTTKARVDDSYTDKLASGIGKGGTSKEAARIRKDAEDNIKRLETSLTRLQKRIVETLDKQFSEAGKKWSVVKPQGSSDPTSAFKLAAGSRQWSVDIANVEKLQNATKQFGMSVDKLIETYKRDVVSTETQKISQPVQRSELIGQWLKTVSNAQIRERSNIDEPTKARLVQIKESNQGVKVSDNMKKAIVDAFGEAQLGNIFKKTYASDLAERRVREQGFVKTLALPAFKTTKTQDPYFQTVHGSQRALPKFVKFETGFENIYKELIAAEKKIRELKPDAARTSGIETATSFAGRVSGIGVRPSPGQLGEAKSLAADMLKALGNLKNQLPGVPQQGLAQIKQAYSVAGKFKGVDLEKAGVKSLEDFDAEVQNHIKKFEKLGGAEQTVDNFVKHMEQLNLSAYDAVKSLRSIKSLNVYDMIESVLDKGASSPLKTVGKQPFYERSVREFEKAIGEVEGTLPLFESNRPRRAYHQENVTNLLTRTAPFYNAPTYSNRLSSEDQKRLIKDLNLEFNEMFKKADRIGRDLVGIPTDIRKLTSLGIPESQAGNVEQYRPNSLATGKTKYINKLEATSVKMYAEDLTELAPFQQFQQAGRNISNVTNAMMAPGMGFETPKLRSERERDLIQSGRYGKSGYGLNVVAELRNTAANFEDQIVISGKLAAAMTEAVKTLVKPSPLGRTEGATVEERMRGTGVSEITTGEIDKVTKKFMEILGAPEEYKGRAYKAVIQDVQKAVATVRGENVEVQQAKLVETFLNSFGRKLTTRYGSKGVSITPTGQPDNILDILAKYGDKAKIKVRPEDTLGYQVAPKSVGELASELFGKNISDEFRDKLITYGNKFMIDIFQNADIIDPSEAESTKRLYEIFAKKWKDVFSSEVPKVGVEGIKQIRAAAEKAGIDTTNIRPIEVRISSYGAAKRGLQTEFMESIFNNLAGAGNLPAKDVPGGTSTPTGTTTIKKLQQKDYERLLGGPGQMGALAKYSEALGYTGSGKTQEQLAPELFKIFGGKGEYTEQLAAKDSKALLAQRAAAVEAASSYYSQIVDEFGKERKGLVGEKFLTIVEEPTKNPEWQREQVERGTKGARLNLPAFSAYASVFGEQSAFMQELEKSLDINASKHWEYMKALQTIQGKDTKFYQNLTKDLESVDIKDVRPFYKSTGVYDREMVTDIEGKQGLSPRSFANTILDVEKFSKAFKLNITGGRLDESGRPMRTQEELYIPGPMARGTYDEPLIAGERGMDQIARRMTHMVNMAKELDDLFNNPSAALETMQGSGLEETIRGAIGAMNKRAQGLGGKPGQASQKALSEMISTLEPLLTDSLVDEKLIPFAAKSGLSEKAFFQEQLGKQRQKVGAGQKSPEKAMAYLVSTLSDLLIGKDPTGSEYNPDAITGVTRAAQAGGLPSLGAKLGGGLTDELIKKKIESLNKAKIEYYSTLAEAATGKSGSVNELLFSRKIPAVMAKATTAVVDKQKDIKIFQKRLSKYNQEYGLGLEDQVTSLSSVAKEHGEAISKYKKIGVPVLGQGELGVPETFAEKIPLEYLKKYDIGSEGITAKQKPELVKSTLAGMLKFIDKLKTAAEKQPEMQQEISAYINEKLVPYIESIRFPFTGTSSIAPFKPKLLQSGSYKDKEGRALETSSIMVPGIPEGIEGLAPIIDKVQEKIDTAVSRREQLQAGGGSQEEIDMLTKQIRELNAAISDVIPKYTSQAQKLDFDGDQIEIHAAQTSAARKDIEAHYKRFHTAQPGGDIRTQDVFMKRFLADAASIKTTGNYVFGESAQAFEKKFPSEKGFKFMQTPFLTEDLEYLSSRESLGVLSGNKQLGNMSNVIQQILESIDRPQSEIADVTGKIIKMDDSDTTKFVDNIMSLIEDTYKDANMKVFQQIESGIKKRLYEEKTGDTIEAQLFKIHTGPETEAMYRVHRLGESAAGFSGGLIGGKANTSDYFKKRFPKIKAMGGSPEEEFHTMLNEFLRFGIQKGMDVKHAGEKPIAGEMVSYLSRGVEGAQDLWSKIADEENKTFGDLRDFAADADKAVRMRLGELPTSEVLKEAQTLASSRGESTNGLDEKTRKELVDIIVDKVGFKGFLEEMSMLIEKSAVEGLAKQAQEWSPAKRKDFFKGFYKEGADLTELAKGRIEWEKGKTGINIAKHITPAQAPLYGTRTFSGSPQTELQKYRDRFGDVEVPDEVLGGISEDSARMYKEQYAKAKATASNIQRELKAFSTGKQTGAYADMINSTIKTMHEQQTQIEMFAKQINEAGPGGTPKFVADTLAMGKGMKDEVERLSDLAGVPYMSATEKFDIEAKYGKEFRDKRLADIQASGPYQSGKISKDEAQAAAEEYAAKEVAKKQASEQLRRVSGAITARRGERGVLDELLPTTGAGSAIDYSDVRRKQFERAREALKQTREPLDIFKAQTRAREDVMEPPGAGGVPGTGMGFAPDGVVKVHLVGADSNAVVSVNVLKSAGFIETPQSPPQQMAAQKAVLDDVLKKISPEFGPGRSSASYFSPSRLAGGGDVYGKGKKSKLTEEKRMQEQLDRIIKSMTEERTDDPAMTAITDWGSVLHAKIQQYFKDKGNVDIERYKSITDEVGGVIGGTADLVEYATPEKQKVTKVIDIKSTTKGIMGRLEKAVGKAGGSTDINDVIEQADDEIKRKLNEYFSQLNAYLKIFDTSATAEVRFYDKEKLGKDPEAYQAIQVKYDPTRFEKDMRQLAAAREAVQKSGKAFQEIQNVPGNSPSLGSWPEADELVKAMKEAKAKLASVSNYGGRRRREGDEMTNEYGINMEQRAKELGKQRRYDRFDPEDIDKFLVPPKIAAGNDVKSLIQNLETLHSQSKVYQKMKGLDMGTLESMPKEIGDAVKAVGEKGPDYQSFIDLTGKLKDMDRPDFTHKSFIDAWKLYRIAVGDFMLAEARKAETQMREFDEAGDERGASEAYGAFEANTRRLQEFVRRSIGKPTDIYTDDKRFVYPGLAKAAEVFLTPEQIHSKVGQGLGDDKELINQFKTITKGLQANEMPAPLDSARGVFEELSGMQSDMVGLLNNAERFGRLGPEVLEAWDFDKLSTRATRLREALQQVAKQSVDMSAEQKKNLENNIKYIKNIESLYSQAKYGKGQDKSGYGMTGIVPVPKFETPEVQRALHRRNIQSVRQYFEKPEEAGGPEVGERFSYQEKIVGQAGETIKNVVHHFQKYGEALDMAGRKTGQFSESQQDIIEKMQRVNASFGNAVRRVIMWGAASRLVYGGVSNLKAGLQELSQIELGIASLRMVMSPLETDFAGLTKSATGFAKQYGVPVTDVLKSMKVFAQQGLKQSEVVDRTQTATLASNVTTLNAKEATEALTSAMKVFREEGTQSMRFLDAWSEVEAKHAITADDMANAIKKSAAAAKSAGITFDQLNGMVAAVGAVTRQTGKEVGTSFRFIFRRLFSEEGPKTLAKLNIPTIDEAGELRPAFEILGDLAGRWKDLSSAQRLNIAQSVGGTRQYNSLLVLMDQWDEALRGIRNSTNSKGSAERRNAEVMKTYAKQLERTRAAATEFKMEIGKIALPVFTAGTKGLTLLFEALTAIPTPIKIAAAALGSFFVLGAKGIDIFDTLNNVINTGGGLFSDLTSEFGKQFDIAKYEITGKNKPNTDVFGLKTLTPYATKVANSLKEASTPLTEQGSKMEDFHSTLGKMMFQMMSWGRSYNELIGGLAVGTGELAEGVGETGQRVGSFLSSAVSAGGSISDILGSFKEGANLGGLGFDAVKKTLTKEGVLKGGAKVAAKAGAYASEVVGIASYATGKVLDTVGEGLGAGGNKIIKDFTTQNAGFVKSVAPLGLTIAGLIPAMKAAAGYFKEMTGNAKDFEQSMDGARRLNESNLKTVRDLLDEYAALEKKVSSVREAQDPATKARRQELGTYESPLTTLQQVQERSTDLSNNLAKSNINLVVGYDKLGNAVLKTGKSFKSYLKDLENLQQRAGVATELEVLTKYLDDLSDGSKSEKIKEAFKELAEAFPVVGNLVARNIKVSPAKALESAAEDLNKRLNIKQRYPLSAAADADIERLQEVLGNARSAYQETFTDMKRVYSGVLSKSSLEGLTKDQIEKIVKSPELRKAYELQIQIDPRFKLLDRGGKAGRTVGDKEIYETAKRAFGSDSKIIEKFAKERAVDWRDIMGKELLTALNPRLAGSLDVTAAFTQANLESAGVSSRQGQAASGDIVTFYKDMADRYNIAGRQAVVKLKDTDEWVVEYFNTRTLELDTMPLDEVERMVEGIFPLERIKEDLSYRMDALNTFTAGAGAGLVGISAKDFKKDFNLGERFFSDLPTSTILQGGKGFTPGAGYGEIPGLKNFRKDLEEYFFGPLDELKIKTEQFQKLTLEGIEGGSQTIDKGFYEEINRLLTILKNNQVVVQFRAVFVDLMKEMSAGQRVLKEEIAIMKRRAEVDRTPFGLTAGSPRGLENLDLGVRDIKDITAQQRLLSGDKGFRQGATKLRELELSSQSNLEMLDKFERATAQLDDILATAKGFGAALNPEDLGKYIKEIEIDGDNGPLYEMSKSNQGIQSNTADTVDRLDKLLENQGDPAAIEKYLSSVTDSLGTGIFKDSKKTTNALERVARIRESAEGRGDQETVMATNKALDVLTKQLIAQVGYKKGIELVNDNFTIFSKRFSPEEFQQRAFGGIDSKVFLDRLKEYGPEQKGTFFGGKVPGLHNILFGGQEALGESDVFKDFQKVQEKQYKEGVFSSKNLARVAAVATTISAIQQSGNKKIISQLDDQIAAVDDQIKSRRESGASAKELTDLTRRREALDTQRTGKQREANFYGTVKALSATKLASTELGRAMGLTENQMKAVGVGSIGLYASLLAASKLMGETLPDAAKDFAGQLRDMTRKYASGEDIGVFDASKLKKAGKRMQEEFDNRAKDIFGKKGAPAQTASAVNTEKLVRDLDESLGRRREAAEAYRAKGPLHTQYADLMDTQLKARAEFYKKGQQGTPAFNDLVKEQKAERAKFLRGLDALEKKEVLKDYDKLPGLGSSEAIKEAMGDSAKKYGEYLTRGLEAGEAPSKIKQLVAAWLAVAVTDYVSGKTADKVALAETEKFAKQQADALNSLYEARPEAFEKTLKSMQEDAARSVATATEDKKLTKLAVQDPERAKKEIEKMIEEQRDAAIKKQKEIAEQQRVESNKLFDQEAREKVKMSQEQAARDSRTARDSFNITRRYSIQNLLNSALQGYGGDVELPLTEQDMSTQQRVYKDAGDSFRKVIDEYSDGVQALGRMKNNLESLKQATRGEEDLIATSKDADVVKMAKERHEELTKRMKDQIAVIEELGEKLKKIGELKSAFDKFSDSIYQLKNALREVGVQEAVERLPGMQGFTNARDMLLGGSNPNAIVPISTEQERMGSRVGIDLRHMRSTQYDVRRAELLDQLRTASGEQRGALERQLIDLPEQQRRDEQVYRQRQYDQRLLRGLTPYEDQLASLERARIAPGTSTDVKGQIGALQTQISTALERALDRMTLGEYRGEIEKNRGAMTAEEYRREASRVDELEKQGVKYTYRQIPTWDKNAFGKTSDDIKAAIQAAIEAMPTFEGEQMRALIANPITEKIEKTNEILSIIAEKEFGIDIDSGGGIFSKIMDAIKGLFGIGKKAGGGSISGPGTGTSDSIPAMLSDGEYVVKAAAVRSLGVPALDYINRSGRLPGFASGGFADYLKEQRMAMVGKTEPNMLMSALNLVGQGGLAATEIASRIVESPIQLIKALGSLDAKTVNSMVEGVKSRGIAGTAKDVGVGIGKSFMGDLKTGGTGITAGIIESLIPMGGLTKAGKLGKSAKTFKNFDQDIVNSFFGGPMSTKDAIAGMRDTIKAYENFIPGFTGKNIDTINLADDFTINHALVDGVAEVKHALGTYYPPATAKKIAKATGRPIKPGKSFIDIDSLSRGMDVGSKPSDILTHELFHDFMTESDVLNSYIGKNFIENLDKPGAFKFTDALRQTKDYGDQILTSMKSPKTGYSKSVLDQYKAGTFSGGDAIDEFISEGVRVGDRDLLDILRKFKDEDIVRDVNKLINTEDFKKFRKEKLKFAGGGLVDKLHKIDFEKDEPAPSKDTRDPGFVETALNYWLKKGAEFVEPKGAIPTNKATSYLESGKSKEERYKQILGYAGGGLVDKLHKIDFEKDEPIPSKETRDPGFIETALNYWLKKGTDLVEPKGAIPTNKGLGYLESSKSKEERYKQMLGYATGGLADEEKFRYWIGMGNDIRSGRGTYAQYHADRLGTDIPLTREEQNKADMEEINRLFGANKAAIAYEARRPSGPAPTLRKAASSSIAQPAGFIGTMMSKNDSNFWKKSAASLKKLFGFASGGLIDDDLYDDRRWAISSSKSYMARQRNDLRGSGRVDRTGRSTFMGLGAQWNTDQLKAADQSKADFIYNLNSYRGARNRAESNTNSLGKLSKLSNRVFRPREGEQGPFLPQLQWALKQTNDAMKSGFASADEQKALADRKAALTKSIGYIQSGKDPFTNEFQRSAKQAVFGGSAPALARVYQRKALGLAGDLTKSDAVVGSMATVKSEFDNKRLKTGTAAAESAGVAMGGGFLKGVSNAYDYIKAFFKGEVDPFELLTRKDKESAAQYHSGGVVAKTGKIFAEAGEVVTPKKLANGGLAEMNKATTASMSIDFSPLQEVVSKLESLELKVEDKMLKVEDTTLKVEDKELKLAETTVKLDATDLPKLTVDINNLPKIQIDTASVPTVTVKQPDWAIPVDVPTDTVTVKVDLGDADTRLSSAIREAINQTVRVEVSGGTNAVGGEKIDRLATELSNLQDKLIFMKNDYNNQIKQLGTAGKDENNAEIQRMINVAISNSTGGILQDLNTIRSDVSRIESTQRRTEVTVEAKLDTLRYDLSQARNQVGTDGIGRYS